MSTEIGVSLEAECRSFAELYPGESVLYAISLAEEGTVTWSQVYNLFHKALSLAIVDVNEEQEG